MIVIERSCESAELTGALAAGLADVVRAGDAIALRGELGAGKTTFARALCERLGVDPRAISSPTFVVMNQYPLGAPVRGIRRIVHADAYRLRGPEDLDSLGWDVATRCGGGAREDVHLNMLLIVEWPERVEGSLPEPIATVRLEATGEATRRVVLELPEAWRGRPGVGALAERPPVGCKVTGRAVRPTAPSYPFADDRARLADLGRWMSGSYTIARDIKPDDDNL